MPASTLKRCLPFSGELFIYFIFWQVELCHSYWGALWASHRKSKQVTIFMLSESIQNMPSCCLNVKEKRAKLFRKNTLCSASNRFWLHVLGAFLKISSEECYTLVLFFFLLRFVWLAPCVVISMNSHVQACDTLTQSNCIYPAPIVLGKDCQVSNVWVNELPLLITPYLRIIILESSDTRARRMHGIKLWPCHKPMKIKWLPIWSPKYWHCLSGMVSFQISAKFSALQCHCLRP